jgi:hypothetical protein
MPPRCSQQLLKKAGVHVLRVLSTIIPAKPQLTCDTCNRTLEASQKQAESKLKAIEKWLEAS